MVNPNATGTWYPQQPPQGRRRESSHDSKSSKDRSRVMEGDEKCRRRDDVRLSKKIKIPRSDSSVSQRISSQNSFGNSAINRQMLAMKKYQRGSSLGSKSLSDSSDDEGGQNIGLSIGSKKRSKSLGGSKKRCRLIDSDTSDDSVSESRGKRRREPKSSKDGMSDALKNHPSVKRKKRAKEAKDGSLHENTANSDKEKSSSIPLVKTKSSSKCSPSGAPRRKRHGGGSPRATASADTVSSGFKSDKKELKPLLKVGDFVSAAWWPDKESRRTNSCSSWYEGKIKVVKEVDRGGEYGPLRYYSIEYDDGDELDNVEDVFVFPRADYLLSTNGRPKWIGVKNVLDEHATDQWARMIGWHVATIDGQERHFSLLTDALRAYDASVVQQEGAKTKPSWLNLPAEWEFGEHLSAEEGCSHESGDETLSISDLKGSSFIQEKKKYQAKIKHGGKHNHLGYYKIASDAALAHDEALKLLMGPKANTNYATEHDHKNMRAMELRRTGLNVDFEAVRAYMSSKVNGVILKVRASSNGEDAEQLIEKKRKNDGKPPRRSDPTPTIPRRDSSEIGKNAMILPDTDLKKKKHSNYVGVSFNKNRKYISYIRHDNKRMNLGSYTLETDAALSVDVAARLLKGPHVERNLSTLQDYERAKKRELERTGFPMHSAMTSAAIEVKVAEIISRKTASVDEATVATVSGTVEGEHSVKETMCAPPAICPEIIALNDAMAKKWAAYLPSETGKEFLDSYQKSIHEILQDLKPVDAPVPSTVSLGNELSVVSLTTKDSNTGHTANINRLQIQSRDENPVVNASDAGKVVAAQKDNETASELNVSTDKSNQPIEEDASTQKLGMPSNMTTCENPHPKSDDKASLSSMNAKAMHTKQSKKPELMELTINQVGELDMRYPVGCSVWFQFDKTNNSDGGDNPGQSFHTGVITTVFIDLSSRDIIYKVKLIGQDGKQSEMIPEHELYYAPRCPVNISPSSPDKLETKGEILMCQSISHQQINTRTVLQLKVSLLKEQARLSNNPNDCEKLLDILHQLANIHMSLPILAESLIGKSIVTLKSHGNNLVAQQARELVKKWKGIANVEKDQACGSHDTFTYFYTVLIIKAGNQFQVMNDVRSEFVKYRKVPKVGAEENESSNSTITTATGLC
eukprot:CAMPEP_0201904980 /NCGR_PEP_ID=MMETSP0902-20130614/56276_1 /ASSEMBLY_ACC=CAM_ASM_000551 /TAXON_ID=420261 /ORGANISM="Thalassiosira antarctica, Strain CCMP982" /LENGTH=1143 /DNA_ID=CAMNT_0048439085 /DNA_START=159 /DNA_END=3590 /DNA_ORIENTATION=+